MMTITERLTIYMEYKGLSANRVTVDAGLSVGQIGKAIKKNGGLNSDTIEKILHAYDDLNPEWFLMEIGEMLKTKNEKNLTVLKGKEKGKDFGNERNVKNSLPFENEHELVISEPHSGYKIKEENKIPLYDGVIIAGQRSLADLSPQTLPIGYINAGDWFKDATGAMQVYDDSMPEYPTGSYVCFKEVMDKSLLIYGQDYVIETSEYRVIKKILRSTDPQFLILASTNTEIWESGELKGRMIHEPFPVHVDAVNKIYKVLGTVNRKESIFIYQN